MLPVEHPVFLFKLFLQLHLLGATTCNPAKQMDAELKTLPQMEKGDEKRL